MEEVVELCGSKMYSVSSTDIYKGREIGQSILDHSVVLCKVKFVEQQQK